MKKLLLILIIFSALTSLRAQEEQVSTSNDLKWKFAIGLVPQYAIVSGMRLDFDLKIKKNQYLTIAPQMYYNENYKMFYPDKTDMRGVGLNLNYRFLYSKTDNPEGPYIGFGLVYKYFDLKYFSETWSENSYLSNTFYTEEYGENHTEFNQFGYDLLIGYQGTYDRFFYDLYLGWGFRLSDFDKDNTDEDYWGETIFDPGYSGFLPTIGFRAGIFLK